MKIILKSCLVFWICFCFAMFAKAENGKTILQNQVDRPADEHQVAKLPSTVLHPTVVDPERRTRLQNYYESILEWGMVVNERVKGVPSNSNWNYIGRPGNLENDIRPTAYAAMVLSFLAQCEPPKTLLDDATRQTMHGKAVGLLRYLCASHVANGGKCANGKPWGNQWQSAMWARSVAMAGWLIWERLDIDLQNQIIRMVEYEANRFVDARPKSSLINDTGAEENAWNASITSLACNMLPNHSNAKAWDQAAKRFMYNTFSVKSDNQNPGIGDDGIPIQDWVTTNNAHDDFTVENHGLVHVGYLKNAISMLLENSVHWSIQKKRPPMACQHHTAEVFDLLCKCMNWNGAPIYFGGNDWRIYETQCSDIIIYNRLRQLSNDRRAGYLEDVAFKHLRKRQVTENGFYNGRRDLEYGGLCATRLIACFFSHAVKNVESVSMTPEEFNVNANGVFKLESAKTVIHRTAKKFASFSWAQKRVALAIPASDNRVVWPHFDSYTGVINAAHSSEQDSALFGLQTKIDQDGFRCSGTLSRCKGLLQQDFYYHSPKNPITIYVERLRPSPEFVLDYRKTGLIGLDYPIGKDARILFGEFGEFKATGKDGKKQTVPLHSNWLNIDNRIGYVVRRSDKVDNVMLFHDKNTMHARKPHLQESIALVSDNKPAKLPTTSWACVVTFMNQTSDETRAIEKRVKFHVNGKEAIVQLGQQTFTVNFGNKNSNQ